MHGSSKTPRGRNERTSRQGSAPPIFIFNQQLSSVSWPGPPESPYSPPQSPPRTALWSHPFPETHPQLTRRMSAAPSRSRKRKVPRNTEGREGQPSTDRSQAPALPSSATVGNGSPCVEKKPQDGDIPSISGQTPASPPSREAPDTHGQI